MSSEIPLDAPPPYSRTDATASSASNIPSSSSNTASSSSNTESSSFLHPNRARNGIPPSHRRSMEDEGRSLPDGWVRSYDHEQHHQYFVDTRAKPPRSIWHHPYDDEEYMKTLPSAERERVQSLHRVPTPADLIAESSDEEDAPHRQPPTKSAATASTGQSAEQMGSVHRFGRKMKDKVTASTHEQREKERNQRAEQERKAYEVHMAFRTALSKSIQTGQPQYIGKDPHGKEVWVEPPGGQRQGYSANGRGVNPYTQGPYTDPNVRFIRPSTSYQRPYGYGYGGGYGLPLAGGLAGGMLLGGALGGMGGLGMGGLGGGMGMGGMGMGGMGMGGMGMGGMGGGL